MRLHTTLPVHGRLIRSGFLLLVLSLPTALFGAEASKEMPARGFGTLDWLIVIVYAMSLVGIGYYYSRRQTTTEEYFVASRNVAPFLAGISLYATMFSTLSYIGNPGEIIQHGPVYLCLNIAAAPFIYLVVGFAVIPLIVKLPVTSAYELLEKRLGKPVRLLGSGIFVITRLIWMAVMLYTTSVVLVTVMGWNSNWAMPLSVITGILTTIYTVSGGFRAVVVSDVLQFFVLFAGAVFALLFITLSMGGVSAWWPTQWVDHWAPQPFFTFDPSVRVTMVGSFTGALIWWVCTSASDQMAIQRYLSTRDAAAARRAFLHNSIGSVFITALLGFVGLAVLGFFRANPDLLPARLSPEHDGDKLFPYLISHFLPMGMPGLIMSGILAASMSSLSSGINSTITVISKDFLDNLQPGKQRTDTHRLKTAHWLAAGIGLTAIAGSQLTGMIPGNLIEVMSKSINLFVCPLFGMFFLALFVPFATPFGAIMGAFYSLTAAALVGYWDLIVGGPGISFQWIAPVALTTTLVCGPLFSLLPTRGKPRRVMAVYSVAAVVPWLVFYILIK